MSSGIITKKFDGTGFVTGLKGNDIPINARVFAVADVFDALTSRRPYKEPLALKETMQILTEGRGSHFDPALVDSFVGIADPLYEEISVADDKLLEKKLDGLIDIYFRRAFRRTSG
ncbi:MAG: HD domain-containing phosphohydrolase [Thermovirgaceae bacterium]|nr:HD domain-containing phosphohydrolase [Thermovirgaceae bacterium]